MALKDFGKTLETGGCGYVNTCGLDYKDQQRIRQIGLKKWMTETCRSTKKAPGKGSSTPTKS